jgi:hypothetical protein
MTIRKLTLVAAATTASLSVCWLCRGGQDLSSAVTAERIKAVRVGMSQAEVVACLGEPKEVYWSEWVGSQRRLTLQFSQPVAGVRWYPMLWVHLQNGTVAEVYAKRYVLWGADDEGVYGLDEQGRWEAESFGPTFPNHPLRE